MKTSSDSPEDTALDALLDLAPRYTPPAGFAESVLAALHEEEEAAAASPSLRRPWYLRPYSWGSAAAAACLVAAFTLHPLIGGQDVAEAGALALDDAVLVEEALDSIEDEDLISAICSVSTGSYSIATGAGY